MEQTGQSSAGQKQTLLPLLCSSFSGQVGKLPLSSCQKSYIVARSRAKYLIWLIMLQVSHQTCLPRFLITFPPSSASCRNAAQGRSHEG